METSLHRQLKERYVTETGGVAEVVMSKFRIDAVTSEGALIEVQSGALGPLRKKLEALLPAHRIQVVKPVIVERRVVRRTRVDGPDVSSRRSPKRGLLLDVFDDMVGLARVFPHPNLQLDLVEVEIDEVRVPRRRWPGFKVVDRRLREVVGMVSLREPHDLLGLVPADLDGPFTTRDLANKIGRPIAFAQRVAYCLRLSNAVETIGKAGNHRIYTASKAPCCRS